MYFNLLSDKFIIIMQTGVEIINANILKGLSSQLKGNVDIIICNPVNHYFKYLKLSNSHMFPRQRKS